jgi:hypothetical protein
MLRSRYHYFLTGQQNFFLVSLWRTFIRFSLYTTIKKANTAVTKNDGNKHRQFKDTGELNKYTMKNVAITIYR